MNIFKKYTAGVFCIESDNNDLQHGDIITVATRHGKEVECTIWKRITFNQEKTHYSYVRADGFNSKERLLKKAERREQWAGSANKKADEYYEKSNKHRDFLSLGEPIKIGHHSEKRHRKMLENSWNNMGKSIEQGKKADEHVSKSDTLKQMSENIFLDNPDCVEQLEFNLEKLTLQRDDMKAGKIPREHSFSLQYLTKNVREVGKKLEIAKKLWVIE